MAFVQGGPLLPVAPVASANPSAQCTPSTSQIAAVMPASDGSRKSKPPKRQKRVILDTIELSSEEDASQSVSLMSVSVLERTVRRLKEVSCTTRQRDMLPSYMPPGK